MLEGILVLLAINVVFAYAAFLPIAAGQLNLGVAGFAAIGGYFSAYLSKNIATVAVAGHPAGRRRRRVSSALAVAVPVLRTRGIYLALATFALGEIVRASILNLEIVGGAAGYPVTAFIRLPTVALFALGRDGAGLATVRHALWHRDHRSPRRRARRRSDGPRRARVSDRGLHDRFRASPA